MRHLPERAHRLDPESVLAMLSDYVNGADTSVRYRMVVNYPNKVPPPGPQIDRPTSEQRVYGVHVYDALARHLGAEVKESISLIPFHILLEHKQLMLTRLRYMEAGGHIDPSLELSQRYRTVVNAASAIKLSLLRRIARSRTGTASTSTALGSLRDLECEILSEVIDSMSHG